MLFNRRQDQLYGSLLRLATGSAEDSKTNSTTVAHRLVLVKITHGNMFLLLTENMYFHYYKMNWSYASQLVVRFCICILYK